MNVEKKKILMNSFFNAQFNYCPPVWMLHSSRNNNMIRNLHERCPRLIYNNKKSTYEELLTKDGSISIHHRNIRALATEFYKIKNGLSPELFTEIFTHETESHYNLRWCNDFRIPSIHTVYHGSESICFLGPESSNINEVIRAVLNSLFFFYKKILHAPKAPKSTKTQLSKSTKTQISKQKQKMRLKKIKVNKSHLFAYLRFCACEEKNRKVPTM